MSKRVEAINALEKNIASLDDNGIKDAFNALKIRRIQKKESLDNLLPEVFALVREASKRTLNMRHFDVQLIGGMALHHGNVTEMKTGEGKTLVATLAASLNALDGKGVHIVTVNDYLAQRDGQWMGAIYQFLGLSVGIVTSDIDDTARQNAYKADITHCTNNELGFDYLRDHLKFRIEDMVLRPLHYAIVDEVDSILIDEARTPLIISGPTNESHQLHLSMAKLVKQLNENCFEKDEKSRSITLTEEGMIEVEKLLLKHKLMKPQSGLFDPQNMTFVHHITQSLRAFHLFRKDHDYIVENDHVVIIDEFTGRKMEGRRYSDGLHQALEAKENVSIQQENQTLASITYQNLFRQYEKLAGMTGTALTEIQEFEEIYSLDVMSIPTHKPMVRTDQNDSIYRTSKERDLAVLKEIKEAHALSQPILVGTASIERSEDLSKVLRKEKIQHKVLNARQHESEAHIIAQAGRPGSVTIATNMAGRGTDIQLGGNVEIMTLACKDDEERQKLQEDWTSRAAQEKQTVINAGGLLVIGTERHESRRIDNQLRGRAGRQGDPGRSRFFISLEDDLMRIFGSEKINGLLKQIGLEEGEAIVHSWIDKAIEKAQQKVEARNFDIRRQLLKFDDVVNDQRNAIFEERQDLMKGQGLASTFVDTRNTLLLETVEVYMPENSMPGKWDLKGLHAALMRIFNLDIPTHEWAKEEGVDPEVFVSRISKLHDAMLSEKRDGIDKKNIEHVELSIMLQVLDLLWKEHLQHLDHLRQGIGLRAYGQRDPLNEFRQEAFSLFEHMLASVTETSITMLSHLSFEHVSQQQESNAPTPSWDPSTPRNAPCPCGSGRKFKHCHGKL
jgi:preprotein translocase subunit SecA